MNIFGKMWDAVFHHGGKGAAPAPKPITKAAPPTPTAAAPAAVAPAPVAPAPVAPLIDVEEVLEALAVKSSQKLNWRSSIVDLMKLLGMESSLSERKELATELHYGGDMKDSAAMNIWLHKEVIRQFAANGGKVPANMLD